MSKARSFISMLGLGGINAGKPAAEEDDDDKKDDEAAAAESDDDESARAEDDNDDKKDDEAARAEGDDNDDEEGEDKDKDSKKASRAARSAERLRCCSIFAHGIKVGMPEMAGSLAMDTGMSVSAAVNAINSAKRFAGRPARAGLDATMAGVNVPKVGVDGVQAAEGDTVAHARALYDAAVGRKA